MVDKEKYLRMRLKERKFEQPEERCPECDGWGYYVSFPDTTEPPRLSLKRCLHCACSGSKEIYVLNLMPGDILNVTYNAYGTPDFAKKRNKTGGK